MEENCDEAMEVHACGAGKITPMNTINLNKRTKKSDRVSDKEILLEFDSYYLKLSQRKNCHKYSNRSVARECNCCAILKNDIVRDSVALYALSFGKMERDDRIKQLRMWYRYANVEDITSSVQKYLLPFDISSEDFPDEVDAMKICSTALMDILGFGRIVWKEVAVAHKQGKSISSHGLRGKKSNSLPEDHDEIIVSLHDHFSILKNYGEVEATRFVREKTGEVTQRDGDENTLYLPTSMGKRLCYRRWCADRGWLVNAKHNSATSLERMADFEGETKRCLTWAAYHAFWKKNYPGLKVRNPSEDICTFCYKFSNRHKFAFCPSGLRTKEGEFGDKRGGLQHRRSNDTRGGGGERVEAGELGYTGAMGGSIIEGDPRDDEKNVDGTLLEDTGSATNDEQEEREKDMLAAGVHVRAARAQRSLYNRKVAECRNHYSYNVRTLVVDYGQNMEIPWFGSTQPGDTYYYSPLTVNNLGIVDCVDDTLTAHVYHEGEGKKGGSNVASLIMKTLNLLGYISETSNDDELNIIFDNCPGQNKNNMVLRLVPYLVEMKIFRKVNFIFLIVGHTKNAADRMFNTMKGKYRVSQCFTMDRLREILSSEKVHIHKLETGDMKNWGDYLNRFYKKIPSIEPFHIFSCDANDATDKGVFVTNSEYDLPCAKLLTYNALKQGFDGRADFPKGNDGLILAIKERPTIMKNTPLIVIPPPGINPYKQVELYKNYRLLMPEVDAIVTCPKPPPEMMELVKNEKKGNKLNKLKKAEMKSAYLSKAAEKSQFKENAVVNEKYEEKII